MYLCNVKTCLLVKIKIAVYRKHLGFYDFYLKYYFVWVKISPILVNFKCNESTCNLIYFNFFKKGCWEIMQNNLFTHKLNLTSKKVIHNRTDFLKKLNFRPFLNFLFLFQLQNQLFCSCKVVFIKKSICIRHFHGKESFQFVSSLFEVRTEN